MKKSKKNRFNMLVVFAALCFLFFLGMESLVFARAGGGRSSGSSGFSSGGTSGGTYRSAPSQPSSGFQQRPQAPTPGAPTPAAPSFGRSLLYGIGGGLIGGAIGSMLFGGMGHAGGGAWGGGGFGFSDFIMILLVLGIAYFIFKRYRAKKQEEMQMSATGGGYSQSYAYNDPASGQVYEPAQANQEDRLSQGLRYIKEMDAAFDKDRFKEYVEDNFFKIQSAWTKRDISGVRSLLSPQMVDTFQNDINNYVANRQFNRLENIAVREVEVVDAGQDQGEEYITVKFLASLLDYTVDETTNKTISGSSTDPVKFLEYWTFQRRIGERNWVLGGITQEGDYR
jgi:predicted lipid-binding transport protein (Tim44 family)